MRLVPRIASGFVLVKIASTRIAWAKTVLLTMMSIIVSWEISESVLLD